MSNAITFPGLGLEFDFPEVAFSIGGLNIRWYGIIIACGFLLAFIYGMKRCEQFGYSQDDLIDMLFIATPSAIIGARLYYVMFSLDQFRGNPARIFQIWTGGLAIYGGVIGALLAAAIVARRKKIKILSVFDLGSLGFLIGQSIGRWGNFANREAYGTITNLPWRMEIFDWSLARRVAVHPTFLYESLWNALGFVLLHFASKRRKYDGQTFLTYVAWYGLGRGLIEGLRTDSLYILDTGLRASQVLAFGSCIVALLILGYNALFKTHYPENMQVFRYKAKLAAATAAAAAETEANSDEPSALSDAPSDVPVVNASGVSPDMHSDALSDTPEDIASGADSVSDKLSNTAAGPSVDSTDDESTDSEFTEPVSITDTEKAELAGNPDFVQGGKLADDSLRIVVNPDIAHPQVSPIEKIGMSDISPATPADISPRPAISPDTTESQSSENADSQDSQK